VVLGLIKLSIFNMVNTMKTIFHWIISGHLLLTLFGNTGPFLSTSLLTILVITQIALSVLESAVAIIQSYVFAVIRTIYSREVN
jgi:ATP synthase A chain.